uniref:Uncharacterized protein n=1 Tax=Anguilla anguilla TaxID=7936 RepID=A0A0E9PSG8_ANGAN
MTNIRLVYLVGLFVYYCESACSLGFIANLAITLPTE